MSRYDVHDIRAVVGNVPAGLAPARSVIRVESDVPIQLAEESPSASESPVVTFYGVTQNLHYTSATQSQELDARSRAEFEPSNEITAVLIPIGKSLKWWQMAQGQRLAHFQTSGEYKGHTAIGIGYVDRVFRKLYHSRHTNPPTPYDFRRILNSTILTAVTSRCC